MTARKLDEFLHETFAALHAMPEVAFTEVRTSAFLADSLEKAGFTVTRNVGTTGVLGVLDSGKPGVNFALRADMDALPFEIDGKTVSIHACGHDANSSMVLTAARRAAAVGIERGRLTVVFQQAEESLGAPGMIKTGLLNGIEEMVGIHLRPSQEACLGEATPALRHSATWFTQATIRGVPSHSARPHLGINAIDVATSVVAAINAIHENPSVPHSVKVTQIASIGNTKNIIPDLVRLTVDTRAAENGAADSILDALKRILNGTAALYGAKIDSIEVEGTPAGEYDAALVEEARLAIEAVLGSALPPLQTTGGEDFQYYSRMLDVKTAYIGIGADVQKGLHHPEMSFTPEALDIGADILERLIARRLGRLHE
jgi:amidohydrolase